jgi:hypothetical protein
VRVAAAVERLSQAVDASREHEREQRREVSAAFSSGVRAPIRRVPSQSQRMNERLLKLTGRWR